MENIKAITQLFTRKRLLFEKKMREVPYYKKFPNYIFVDYSYHCLLCGDVPKKKSCKCICLSCSTDEYRVPYIDCKCDYKKPIKSIQKDQHMRQNQNSIPVYKLEFLGAQKKPVYLIKT
jgi:hypothetical protein